MGSGGKHNSMNTSDKMAVTTTSPLLELGSAGVLDQTKEFFCLVAKCMLYKEVRTIAGALLIILSYSMMVLLFI